MRDPKLLEHARQWIEVAESDLRSAEILLAADPPDTRTASFHCQQAGEKYLKAFIVLHGEDPPRIHTMRPLLALTERIDPSLRGLLSAADALTPFAVDVRYPSRQPFPTREEAEQALENAHQIREAILQRIPTS